MSDKATNDLAALRLLQSWPGLAQISNALNRVAGQPNFVATVPRTVTAGCMHSDMLTWLLTPGEWLGLGDALASRFVRQVLESCGDRRPVTPGGNAHGPHLQ